MKLALCAAILAIGPVTAAQAAGRTGEKPMRTETSFDLVVHAPYSQTAAFFGPEGERVWAGKHWDPQFIYPQPAKDQQGAVFTMKHGPMNAVWVIAQHDLEARHFQYVYFIADLLVTTIDVRFTPVDPATTRVHVLYARTAVSTEGEEHVAVLTRADETAGREWQQAIDHYLENRK